MRGAFQDVHEVPRGVGDRDEVALGNTVGEIHLALDDNFVLDAVSTHEVALRGAWTWGF